MHPNRYYIPERFEREIVLHAARILKVPHNDAPVILAISGPPGNGKTYQCSTILKRLGFRIFSLTSSDFESKDAGVPAQKLKETYEKALDYVTESPDHLAAMLIDDADVAFGNWGPLVQYTVNTQGVIGELMRIANKPTDSHTLRVPIYLTGNDLTKFYGPLRREGRMNFFFWEPELSEKEKMVFYLFDSLSQSDCAKLVSHVDSELEKRNLPSSSVAFYSSLTAHLYDELIWNAYLNNRNHRIFANPLDNIDIVKDQIIVLDTLINMADHVINELEKSWQDHTNTMYSHNLLKRPLKG